MSFHSGRQKDTRRGSGSKPATRVATSPRRSRIAHPPSRTPRSRRKSRSIPTAPIPPLIAQRFRTGKRVGRGSFGLIYRAYDQVEQRVVAVKLESVSSKHPQLAYEYRVYQELHKKGQNPWIPHIHWFGQQGAYNALVMDLLGPSLQSVMDKSGPFSVEEVCHLAPMMIERVAFVHSMDLIHRDIKPDNFLLGRGSSDSQFGDGNNAQLEKGKEKKVAMELEQLDDSMFLIDFGLSKRFRYAQTRKHIKPQMGKQLTGTARYASLHTHQGWEQSRRDDIESLTYVFVYMIKGRLPWQGQVGSTRALRNKKIGYAKRSTTVETLCTGLPEIFYALVNYARNLSFAEKPDYQWMCNVFRAFEQDNFLSDDEGSSE